MQSGQIEGAPGWSDSVRYDIVRLTGIIALSTGETVLDQTGFRCRVLRCKFDV
jgi:hypothetical protein